MRSAQAAARNQKGRSAYPFIPGRSRPVIARLARSVRVPRLGGDLWSRRVRVEAEGPDRACIAGFVGPQHLGFLALRAEFVRCVNGEQQRLPLALVRPEFLTGEHDE